MIETLFVLINKKGKGFGFTPSKGSKSNSSHQSLFATSSLLFFDIDHE